MLQLLRLVNHEQSIGLHLLEPDLGWIKPPNSAAGDPIRLLGERSLSELLQAPHRGGYRSGDRDTPALECEFRDSGKWQSICQ
jgi:hypothetical protein